MVGGMILLVSGSGETMGRSGLNSYVYSTLSVTRHMTRSIQDLENAIVENECLSKFTGNQGSIEALKSKKKVLADLLDT